MKMTPSSHHQTDARRTHMRRIVPMALLAIGFFAVTALAGATPAHAEDTASCQFLEIQASNDGAGIDDKLKPLKKKFERPPFSSWKKYSLQRNHDETLQLTTAKDIRVGTSSKLSVLYKQYTKGKKERFKLQLTLSLKNGKKAMDTGVTVTRGDYLLISVSSKADQAFLLAVTCKK